MTNLTIDALKEQAMEAYGDLHDRDTRHLHWNSNWMSAHELSSFLAEAIPSYENFDGQAVADVIRELTAYDFCVGREYSVVIYVRCADGVDGLKKVFQDLHADEIDIQENGALRVWWD